MRAGVNEGLTEQQMADVMRRWSGLGSTLPKYERLSCTTWDRAHCMTQAFWHWSGTERVRFKSLLEESNRRLSPLGEPLLLDFGAHRWLQGDREEAYSDWLAWIINGLMMRDPEAVLSLFGIAHDEDMIAACRGRRFAINREVRILDGARRLDLVIRDNVNTLIVVEVKVTGADDAETAKQKHYLDWMKSQKETRQYPILLATEAVEKEYEKFQFVSWPRLCIGLRKMAQGTNAGDNRVLTAMVLAFVGAVEQNLLRFPSPDAPVHSNPLWSEAASHIERSLKGGLSMGTHAANQSEEEFLSEGFRSYVDALFAIKAFRKQVLAKSERVLNAKLNRLREVTGADLEVWTNSFPDKAAQDNWTAEVSWLTAGVTLSDHCHMWFGLVWRGNDANEGSTVFVTGSLTFNSATPRAVLEKLLKLGANETGWNRWVRHEVSLSEPVPSEAAQTFPQRLDLLIDRWIQVWEQVGGLKGLLEV